MAKLTHADLAMWLLDEETRSEIDQTGQADAAERVGQKVSRPLSRVVSPAGTQAVLSRALHIARANHALLEPVRAGTGPERCFEGLDMRDADPGEARQALVALLATLFDLLDGFIGDDLILRMVQEVWPALPIGEPSQSERSDDQQAAS